MLTEKLQNFVDGAEEAIRKDAEKFQELQSEVTVGTLPDVMVGFQLGRLATGVALVSGISRMTGDVLKGLPLPILSTTDLTQAEQEEVMSLLIHVANAISQASKQSMEDFIMDVVVAEADKERAAAIH